MAQPPNNNLLILAHGQEEGFIVDVRCDFPYECDLAGMKVYFRVVMCPVLDVYKEDFSLISTKHTVGCCCILVVGFALRGAVPFWQPVAAMEVYICHLYGQWDFFPIHEDVEQISP